jgi:hypothetical protein
LVFFVAPEIEIQGETQIEMGAGKGAPPLPVDKQPVYMAGLYKVAA